MRGVTDRATALLLPCRIAFLIAEGETEEGGNKGECQGGASLGTERKSFLNPKTVE